MLEPASSSPEVQLFQSLLARPIPAVESSARMQAIAEQLLRESPRIREANFSLFGTADLEHLFDLYDGKFFNGQLRRTLKARGQPLWFKLSRRLRSAAGLTKQYRRRQPGLTDVTVRYEIAISSTLLYQSFADVERPVRVNGLVCHSRIEALQRIFEHELIHLLEMMIQGNSSCSADLFRTLAWNIFGHTQTRHDLVTQHERAAVNFAIRLGDRVAFTFEGRRHVGVVNRITQRATILVEDAAGTPYRDGRRYRKYYVPLSQLQKEPT